MNVRKPKVLLVSRCAWTLHTFRSGLIRFLRMNGLEVLAAGFGRDGYADKVKGSGVTFYDIPVSRSALNPLHDLRLLWVLIRLYRSTRPDVVHHFTIKPVIYGSIAARIAGVPRVMNTITGLGFAYTGAASWVTAVVSFLYRLALRQSSVVFFQNDEDMGLFVRRGIVAEEKCRLVAGSGVDLEYFRPTERCQKDTGTLDVLFVGRLLKDKGIYELIESAKQVKANFPNVVFHIVGERDERNPTCIRADEIAEAVERGTVVWHGRSDDVRSWLCRADIVVLPSYREGTPRSLLEAAAMGLPIVATDVAGCRNAVDHEVTGLLVPEKDPLALAGAISRLIADRELRLTFGKAGRRKMEKEFDEKFVFRSTLVAYNDE